MATSFIGASIGIGRTITTNSSLANVAEVIIYPIGLTTFESSKVESYLALKYGIALDQTTSQDYFLSNNLSAWDSFAAGLVNSDIAGIVRDDISGINQPKSQSINNTGDIIVSSVGGISTDLQSLIWANDGSGTTSFSVIDSPPGYQHIAREWQFQEKNGDIGNVKISYPASSLPVGALSPIYMFVDNNSIFATGSSVYMGTLVSGNWEFTANISDMQYITFGQSAGDTVAPVISSISHASGSLMPIGNFPLVVTYSDTGSSINTASFTGRIYSWDATGSVWNTTNLAPSYMTLSGAATTSTGNLTIAGLPFGKYRFDISVADNAGNMTTQSMVYYVDAIDWSISSDTYDIGTLSPGPQIFGTGEMIVTVRTVGAAFSLSMIATNTLAK